MIKGTARSRIFWLVLVLLVIIGGVSIGFRKTEKSKEFINAPRTKNPLLEDKDRDGLQAWEEELYGTDPKKSDTDGDGTPDGEEVARGGKPLRTNDASTTQLTAGDQTLETAGQNTEPVNLTEELIAEIINKGGITSLIQGGGDTTSQIIAQKIDELAKQGKIPAPLRTADNLPAIKTSEDSSPAAVKAYLGKVAESFIANISQFKKDDLDLFFEALQADELERLEELAVYQNAIETVEKQITPLTVPRSLSWFHERELQYLQETARQLGILAHAEADPVSALAIIPQRVDLKIEVIKLHRGELPLWLKAQNIIINQNEKAFYLVN